MRPLETIKKDIERCKAQIAATYKEGVYSIEDQLITRQGFQKQLSKLNDELVKHQSLKNIEVINPRLVRG